MAVKLMRAVQYDSYGGGASGLKHVEVPVPKPSKGELLLKLEATSINPIDWKIQKGMLRPLVPPKFPWIPATDLAGVVMDVGPGVTHFKVGDKVVSKLSITTSGGLSEYVVSGEKLTVLRPPEVSAAEGAGLPVAGLTALQALTYHAGITIDKTTSLTTNILITAASGGVGQYAVQLAKLGNNHVTATCGDRNMDLVKGLGADEVIDYKTPLGAALKSPSGKKYDVVIHCAPPIPWSTFEPNLSPNGKVIDVTPSPSAYWRALVMKVTCSKKKLVPMILSPEAKNLEYLVGLVKEGKLKTTIDSKYPLSKAGEAWDKSIGGHATDKLMRAVQYDSYGVADLEHVEVPIPKPSKGELLIKVEATSINPVDWKVQRGILRPLFPLKFPCIPATDVAGEVIDVGPGITRFKVGDKVVSMTTIIRNGGLSEYAVGSETMTVLRPPEVSAAEGAGLPIAGLTALQALTYHAGITLDKTTSPTITTNILITAASGGVGQYAVQLAKLGNVHVTATCGNHNIDLVKGLGADEVIDYKTPQGEALKSPSANSLKYNMKNTT